MNSITDLRLQVKDLASAIDHVMDLIQDDIDEQCHVLCQATSEEQADKARDQIHQYSKWHHNLERAHSELICSLDE